MAATHPEFANVHFAPHDFRRLFATELVNNGLPIHIGAALLGHLDIRTTRGYVAVFDEDVISHYQQFLARRRTERPTTEYREPTRAEWTDFQDHFDKRRVELGSCGRPYGTPCAHEHACLSELSQHEDGLGFQAAPTTERSGGQVGRPGPAGRVASRGGSPLLLGLRPCETWQTGSRGGRADIAQRSLE
ncbi:tyrosine-type recombinase/integrase [Streptomyces scopuliridis]|uniref:tyrosine-type recombinase/integrase n=1 Tax=Streptomyces scopuliridis TaxID=452529 RepID=UPI0036A03DB2